MTQREQLKKLRAFAQAIFADFPDLSTLDGGDIQALGIDHGLLTPVEMSAPCDPDCFCAEYHGSDASGFTCNRRSGLLDGEGDFVADEAWLRAQLNAVVREANAAGLCMESIYGALQAVTRVCEVKFDMLVIAALKKQEAK